MELSDTPQAGRVSHSRNSSSPDRQGAHPKGDPSRTGSRLPSPLLVPSPGVRGCWQEAGTQGMCIYLLLSVLEKKVQFCTHETLRSPLKILVSNKAFASSSLMFSAPRTTPKPLRHPWQGQNGFADEAACWDTRDLGLNLLSKRSNICHLVLQDHDPSYQHE